MHTPAGFEPGHTLPDSIGEDSIAFAFSDGKLLVSAFVGEDDTRTVRVPTWRDLDAVGLAGTPHFLGTLENVCCVAVNLDAPAARAHSAPEGWQFSGLRPLFFAMPEPLLALAGRAFQVIEWDRTHRFCGHCGTAMRDKAGERARECPGCAHVAYPRVSPAMMVLVTRGREMLLARANRFPPGMFSALAGFVEPGETIEDCIHREVREEVGIEVRDPVYFGSQSWAFPHSLMIAFTAEYAGGALRPDETEIVEAGWFTPESLPKRPMSISIARKLIDATANRLRELPT